MRTYELINGPYDGTILELPDNLGSAICNDGGISLPEPEDWKYYNIPFNPMKCTVRPSPRMCRYNDEGWYQIDEEPPVPEHWPLFYLPQQ